jgi:hypothetical protein
VVATLSPRQSTATAGTDRAERHLAVYGSGTQAGIDAPVASIVRLRPRLDPSVYRRRRLLAGGLFLLAVAAVLVLVQLIQAGIGGGPLATTGAAATSAGPMIPAGARDYVVRPGDTVWSIAEALDPNGDERPVVDVLVKELHGTTLYPGEVVAIPAGA